MRHRKIVKQVIAHAYREKRAARTAKKEDAKTTATASNVRAVPPPSQPVSTASNEPLPPLPDSTPPKPSPFPGGKTLTQNEHTIAEDLHDWILGGQDGIVNLLGTMLGVAVVTRDPTILIVTGLASAAAEAVSMAAVAFTSMRASQSYYESQREHQRRLIIENPALQREILIDAYERRGLAKDEATRIVTDLIRDQNVWLEMLMEEHLHLYAPEKVKPTRSAAIVGTASAIGSMIPVIPFFFMVGYPAIIIALLSSAIVLFGGGALSAKLTIGDWRKRGMELVTIAMIAAGAGFGIGWLFTHIIIP